MVKDASIPYPPIPPESCPLHDSPNPKSFFQESAVYLTPAINSIDRPPPTRTNPGFLRAEKRERERKTIILQPDSAPKLLVNNQNSIYIHQNKFKKKAKRAQQQQQQQQQQQKTKSETPQKRDHSSPTLFHVMLQP